MTIVGNCALKPSHVDPVEACLALNRMAEGQAIFTSTTRDHHPASNIPWRISPEPFCISKETHLYVKSLGNHLLRFYQAANKLYYESIKDKVAPWVAAYLEQGKPEHLIEYARMNRQKKLLPAIIRPDLIFTDEGRAIACELDSVPGGQGFVSSLSAAYSALGFETVGGADGMLQGFSRMIRAQVPEVADPLVAIVISQESNDYWNEMVHVADALNAAGLLRVRVVRPEGLRYADEAFWLDAERLDVIYRFFELFDLKNVPKTELMMYAAKKQQVVVTPPFKTFLEEKMLFALFHHPMLQAFWLQELGAESFHAMERLIPRTWIVDARPLPPHGVIPGLAIEGRSVSDFRDLIPTTKKQREYVLKPSGFSELAWGSRGITFGSDTPSEEWATKLEAALSSFAETPYLLQEYHKPAKVESRYYDFNRAEIRKFDGRVRLCPYYFVDGDQAHLHGILATVAPADKKAIHGMVDSTMVPVMVE
ncbi:MAG TPA: hypothetical protein V6D00_10245 [Pantanalinema sp.]